MTKMFNYLTFQRFVTIKRATYHRSFLSFTRSLGKKEINVIFTGLPSGVRIPTSYVTYIRVFPL